MDGDAMIQALDVFLWNTKVGSSESIINKAIEVVSNYAHYAQLAGISDKWTNKISEEVTYRIKKVKT